MSGAALQDRYVQSCLGGLHVRVGGNGPAILFWPSLLMTGSMWAEQARYFADRYTVILVDPPGHGDSQALHRMFRFEDCAHSIEQILDTLGIERAHIVGNSWGGMIGGTFAALHPGRAGASVLMNATASRANMRQTVEFRMLTEIVRLLGRFREPLTTRAVKAFVGPTIMRERPQVEQAIRAELRDLNVDSVYWAVNSVVPARPDQRELFGRISTPILVVAGREDPTFPVAETELMAEAIPGAEFVIMENTGHLAALERPDEVNALIDEFLKRHPLEG
ncbi:alpha/beta fold hydrolase [Mycobacteroides chelonae]|jgi:pimeloyl-ACP methyl ester carboxylesterase|uniref:alpha/beta fold hydrolase n=1 Tax=Mycobacteroides chelonae TaxID=1774 RepID=UPI0007A0E2DB|nr:alpha/beta fold hydrolase [Mycobacteroides chelonae]AMW18101.1 3-oxoadipate enol-lactonase [Mycobacterium sp. QIA-37]AYM40491.1 alpha/beta hydrolase [[Mycobacterium] chelonae subsp. gwanakae]MBF9519676.1 alpha/beta fold hydrolase [Mycobacteroides chelonae]OHU16074.1 alpha/beta hydrolase [Mycobacteroides chelonae]GLE55030.1 putative hydrolase, alpha/beta fold protein [Mycobacteroides chelonae]